MVKDKPGVVKSANKDVESAIESHKSVVKQTSPDVMIKPNRKMPEPPANPLGVEEPAKTEPAEPVEEKVVLPTVEKVVFGSSSRNKEDDFKYVLIDDDDYKYEEVGPITVKDVIDKKED